MNRVQINTVALSRAFKLSMPTLFAYFPLGIVYGILFVHSGFAWFLAPIMSVLVYSGSVQLVALGLMSKHAAIMGIVLTTVFVGLRNAFYGLSLFARFEQWGWVKYFLGFTLVDANYAILTSPIGAIDSSNDKQFCVSMGALMYGYWVFGTLVGAFFADWLPPFPGAIFLLPCFFLVLVIEYFIANRQWRAIVLPIIMAFVAYWVAPGQYLLLSILLCVAVIVAWDYWETRHG